MKLPPKLILEGIKDFAVLLYKDTQHDIAAPPHFFLIFPITDDPFFAVAIITSQIERKESYYGQANPKALASLVRIGSGTFPFLSRESVIECNQTEMLSVEELTRRIDPKYSLEVKAREIPLSLKKQVLQAITLSPLVPPYIKHLLKQKYREESYRT